MGVWFGGLFLFLSEIENGDKNVFGWIFENIFSKNIFPNEPETIKSYFQLKLEISFWVKLTQCQTM